MLGFNFIFAANEAVLYVGLFYVFNFMSLHASIKIIIYFSSLILLNILSIKWLLVFFIASLLLAIWLEGRVFTRRMINMRWLILSIFLVYALTTPGEYLSVFDRMLLVTKEGLVRGSEQSMRLLSAISCLSILFYQATVNQLIGGLRQLAMPIILLGFNVDRFIVRLLLTLEYVDVVTLSTKRAAGFLKLHAMVEAASVPAQLSLVEVNDVALATIDYVVLFFIALLLLVIGLI